MAFLDNSGDIILDAVLTDAGRKRLARGDGTFKVTKYAFGDDEIDYGSYNANHASGSAYFDLEILQTPILEAFTNNRSSVKSRLITLTNNNILYLPELVLNEVKPTLTAKTPDSDLSDGSFVVSLNAQTTTALESEIPAIKNRFMFGYGTPSTNNGTHIRVDQGLQTTKLPADVSLSSELTEQQYLLTIDNRFGMITDVYKPVIGSPSFIDDDQIATYYVTQNVNDYIVPCETGQITDDSDQGTYVGAGTLAAETISGPRGTKLRFGLFASDDLKSSSYLFDTLGSETTVGSTTFLHLNATVKVVGVTTGYHIDIPITFVKKDNT